MKLSMTIHLQPHQTLEPVATAIMQKAGLVARVYLETKRPLGHKKNPRISAGEFLILY